MAISVGNTLYFSGFPSINEYGRGAEIQKVANGFIVKPRTGCGSSDSSETYVFKDAAELAAWVRKQYTPKPAKPAKKAARNG